MHYYRDSFTTFAEFKRESFHDREELGKDELELLHELDDEERFDRRPRGRRSAWD